MAIDVDRVAIALRRSTGVPVLTRDMHGFDESRRIFNMMIDRTPILVARPRTAKELAEVTKLLIEEGVPFTVRAGGHSISGDSVRDGAVVVDLRSLRSVEMHASQGWARVEPGALWADLDAVAWSEGLGVTGGIVSHTGVAGLTLGGGLGWLMGEFGLACDNLIGLTAVDARGELHDVAEGDPDLWAFRGQGRGLGVVCELRLRLHPLPPQVTAGRIVLPLAASSEVATALSVADDTGPTWLTLSPAMVSMDGEWRLAIDYVSLRDGRSTDAALTRALGVPASGTGRSMSYPEAQQMMDDDLRFGRRNYWKSLAIREITPEVQSILSSAVLSSPSDLTMLTVDVVHGAALVDPHDASSFSIRGFPFVVLFNTIWTDATDDRANVTWARRWYDELNRATGASGITYENYFSADDEPVPRDEGYEARLSAVRQRWSHP